MENNPHEKTWEEIQDHGVLSNIQNWEDYVTQYEIGFIECDTLLKTTPNLWAQKTIVDAHRLIFEAIAPWAGEFSSRQEIIASIPGSPPELRDEEFGLLEQQMDVLEKSARSDMARIRMVAFFHARLLCMHPFRDGNGRVSRILLNHQMVRITGKNAPLASNKAGYIRSLQAAHPSGNLAPLSNLLCQSYLGKPDPAKFLPVPFRMNSRQMASQPAGIEDSIREGPEIINAKQTPEKVRWLMRITWHEIEQLVAAKPTKNLDLIKTLWEETQHQEMSPDELKKFLGEISRLEPFVQRIGLLRKQGTSWNPVFNKLMEPYRNSVPHHVEKETCQPEM